MSKQTETAKGDEIAKLQMLVGQGIQIEHRLRKALERIATIDHNLGTLSDTHLLGKAKEIARSALLGEP